ncbi:unnamed protein product [Boreogadus saida]
MYFCPRTLLSTTPHLHLLSSLSPSVVLSSTSSPPPPLVLHLLSSSSSSPPPLVLHLIFSTSSPPPPLPSLRCSALAASCLACKVDANRDQCHDWCFQRAIARCF